MGDKIKAIWTKIKQQAIDIFDKDKGIFFLVALLAVIVKFRDILIDILINGAKRTMNSANKQDSKLATQENQDKQQADTAVKDAQKIAAQQQVADQNVTDDWYKNNK